jgi:hypothetical protein
MTRRVALAAEVSRTGRIIPFKLTGSQQPVRQVRNSPSGSIRSMSSDRRTQARYAGCYFRHPCL